MLEWVLECAGLSNVDKTDHSIIQNYSDKFKSVFVGATIKKKKKLSRASGQTCHRSGSYIQQGVFLYVVLLDFRLTLPY